MKSRQILSHCSISTSLYLTLVWLHSLCFVFKPSCRWQHQRLFFKKWAILGLFSLFLVFFKQSWIQYFSILMWKYVHPVSSAGIRTHDLQFMSLLFLPLDHGSQLLFLHFFLSCLLARERVQVLAPKVALTTTIFFLVLMLQIIRIHSSASQLVTT